MLNAETIETIVSVITPPGRGAVGVVRISGQDLMPWVFGLCGQRLKPREATLMAFADEAGVTIDQGLAIYFPAPNSYTGESVLELQAHGGVVVLQMLVQRCLALGSTENPIRLATPGEFTLRAFLNHKIDLTQAEAIADLIDASTQLAAQSAAQSLVGEFSKAIVSLEERLKSIRILIEANIDFPEEEDVEAAQLKAIKLQLDQLAASLTELLSQTEQGVILREGIKVVLAGQPNVGKSSLLNALLGIERAIVTPIAGTTRDTLKESLHIDGVPLHIVDTAGLRDAANDEVEHIGIHRAWQEIEEAQLVIFLKDLTRQNDAAYLKQEETLELAFAKSQAKHLTVWNKLDKSKLPPQSGIVISAKTKAGLDELKKAILDVVGYQPRNEGVYLARARHVEALKAAQGYLSNSQALIQATGAAWDLLAEELNLMHRALQSITGQYLPDDLLGDIFSHFCIGK